MGEVWTGFKGVRDDGVETIGGQEAGEDGLSSE
jgi:hypothetical protein